MSGPVELWAALGVLSGVTHSAVAYALVSALHVFGIALLVGPILLVDLDLLGRVRGLDANATTLLRRTARIGLLLAVATGVLLAATRPHEYLANRVFATKLAVVALGIVNAAWFEARARAHRSGVPYDNTARVAAVVSIAVWLTALGLGRWIAFA